jgi:hypothetical protein
MNKYTKADKQYIASHYLVLSDAEMAEQLGHSRSSVEQKRIQLRLLRGVSSPTWSDEENRTMRDNRELTNASLAELIGRTAEAVKRHREEYAPRKSKKNSLIGWKKSFKSPAIPIDLIAMIEQRKKEMGTYRRAL